MQIWQIFAKDLAKEWHTYPFLSDITKALVMSANANVNGRTLTSEVSEDITLQEHQMNLTFARFQDEVLRWQPRK